MSIKPKPTPWGELIRVAREAKGLSRPAAAKLAGISPDNWGNVERGYQSLRGTSRAVTGTPPTVAHMANVVGVTPDRLRAVGNSDAATVLEEMIRQGEATASRDGRTRYADATDEYLSHTPGLSDDDVRGLIALARHFRSEPETGSGSGSSR